MLKIGLTGGIGSGKSTVAAIFEKLGIPVYYADLEARRLMNEDAGLRSSILSLFGKEAYTGSVLNRPYISSVVFNDKEKLASLNALVHPVTIRNSELWVSAQTSRYVVREAALIFESGVNKHLDYVIGVSAPEELRISRVMARDGVPEEAVRSRMSHQLGEEEKMKRCDFVVANDDTRLLLPQVLALHEKFSAMPAGKTVQTE